MTKTFKATWLGDEDPQSQIVTIGGVRFIKGDATTVPGDIEVNGMPWAETIRNNPTFAIDDEEADVVGDEEDEMTATKRLLDEAGIKYRANASIESLRQLLADA